MRREHRVWFGDVEGFIVSGPRLNGFLQGVVVDSHDIAATELVDMPPSVARSVALRILRACRRRLYVRVRRELRRRGCELLRCRSELAYERGRAQ